MKKTIQSKPAIDQKGEELFGLLYSGWGAALIAKTVSYGLLIVVFAISGYAIWSAVTTGRLGREAIQSHKLSVHYSEAANAVGEAESLERKYRLEPSPEVLRRYNDSIGRLNAALTQIELSGVDIDKETAIYVRDAEIPYRQSIDKMFAAVDSGNNAEVLRLDGDFVDPTFEKIEKKVVETAAKHSIDAIRALNSLREREDFNSQSVPVVFSLGLIFVVLFSLLLRRTSKQLGTQRENALYASLHDSLTGLANRSLLNDRFEHALRTGVRNESVTGLLLIDLDRFKEVNDTLGHHHGDRLLIQISDRLKGALRDGDTIARLGGDEFAVVLPGVHGLEGAMKVAHHLRKIMIDSFELDGVALDVEASIGVVVSSDHGHNSSTLMQRADVAMYSAKRQGTGVMSYDLQSDQNSPQRLQLLSQLRKGLDEDELFLQYQPKIKIATGEILGVEALVRWQSAERGLIRPDEFIPFAEHTGIIGPLTHRVLELALRQVKSWGDEGLHITVSVNISARNLQDDKLFEQVKELLHKYDLAADVLTLEVTESAIMLDSLRAQAILEKLDAIGAHISIDDFGAGYTSMAQLKNLPIRELKIDKSFVLAMKDDGANLTIVRSIVELGHNLGMSVVAEGVETAEVLNTLMGFQCDIAQGYHLCRPISAKEFIVWYKERSQANQIA